MKDNAHLAHTNFRSQFFVTFERQVDAHLAQNKQSNNNAFSNTHKGRFAHSCKHNAYLAHTNSPSQQFFVMPNINKVQRTFSVYKQTSNTRIQIYATDISCIQTQRASSTYRLPATVLRRVRTSSKPNAHIVHTSNQTKKRIKTHTPDVSRIQTNTTRI